MAFTEDEAAYLKSQPLARAPQMTAPPTKIAAVHQNAVV